MSALEAPVRDPEGSLWVAAPSEEAKVEAALEAVTVAAAEAQLCWRRAQEALEANVDVEVRLAAFEVAARQCRFAWAVYHGACADAGRTQVA